MGSRGRTQGRTQLGERGDASPLVVLTTETTPAFPTTTVHATRRRGKPGELQWGFMAMGIMFMRRNAVALEGITLKIPFIYPRTSAKGTYTMVLVKLVKIAVVGPGY